MDAVLAGMSPDEMADRIVRGIRERKLHIFSHPEWLEDQLQDRMDNILAGRPISNPLA
jgi:hypothetical protein